MIRLEIGLEIRHRGVMSLCVIKDKTVVVVVASYHRIIIQLHLPAAPCLTISTAGSKEQFIDTPSYRLFTNLDVKTNLQAQIKKQGSFFQSIKQDLDAQSELQAKFLLWV